MSSKLLAAIAPYAKSRGFDGALLRVARASRHRYETYYDFIRVSNHYELPAQVLRALFASGDNSGEPVADSYFEGVLRRNQLTYDEKSRLIEDLKQSKVNPKAVLDIALLHIQLGDIDSGERLAVEAIKKLPASALKKARKKFADLPSPQINRALGPGNQAQASFLQNSNVDSRLTYILSKSRPGEAVRFFYRFSNFDSAANLGLASWPGLDLHEKLITIRSLHGCFRLQEAKQQFEHFLGESLDEISVSANISLQAVQASSLLEIQSEQLTGPILSRMHNLCELTVDELALMEHFDSAKATSEVFRRLSTDLPAGNDWVRLIEIAERLRGPGNLDFNLVIKLLEPSTISIKKLLIASRNLRYEVVVDELTKYSPNGFKPFFLNPQLLRISFLDDINGEGTNLRSEIADFWLSPDVFGDTRLLAASPDKRESLLSRLIAIDPDSCSEQISKTSFSSVHLYHRTAASIMAFKNENYDLALEDLNVVTSELPRLSLARNLLNMALLRCNPSPLVAIEAQKEKTHSNCVDSAVFSAIQMSGVYDRTLLDSYQALIERVSSETPNFHLFEAENFSSGDSVLVLENWGVSDEVRAVQELTGLEKRGLKLSVVCDPRFASLFREAFPHIEFLPFARKHKVQRKQLAALTESTRDLANTYLSRFTPGGLSGELSKYDHVTFLDSLVQARLARRERPVQGGYIKLGGEAKKEEVFKIGFVWRSAILSGMRSLIYMSVDEMIQPFLGLEGVKLVSVQHGLSKIERQWLSENGVEVPSIDFYDDFEAVASFCKGLDLVIGLSTSSFEIAAAVGTPVWTPGFSPENYFLRTAGGQTRRDVLTSNSEVFAPQEANFGSKRHDILSDIFGQMRVRIESIKFGAMDAKFLLEPEAIQVPEPLSLDLT